MEQFLTLNDLPSLSEAVNEAIELKKNPFAFKSLGNQKNLGMLFFNPSLRTRLSSQKAAQLLGLKTMVMNFSNEAWALEFEDGTQMSGLRSEHIKEAAAVVSPTSGMPKAFINLSRSGFLDDSMLSKRLSIDFSPKPSSAFRSSSNLCNLYKSATSPT